VPKPFLTSLNIGIPWIKLHTSFRVWSLSNLQLVSKMIENIWHNFTPTFETVNKDNDDKVFSSIFLKAQKKRIIRVCLNRIECMSLLWCRCNLASHQNKVNLSFEVVIVQILIINFQLPLVAIGLLKIWRLNFF
jgi:diphthamide synthase (EF-2-diphthine--ammonia ligase)